MAVTKTGSCPKCKSANIGRDMSSSGALLCFDCGWVIEENPIVSEVQFGESASGAATVQGSMVGSDQARAYNPRNSLESREQTINNAKSKIKTIAQVMRIPDHIVESASSWFKLALVQNFVQGRRSQNVIAACLYVACRHEKTHHLLIDFSSRLQISVYSLGATYLKLVRALQIQRLPPADPSLFIQHFAERLNFGEHTAKVCRDATKIAQRMSSDWIYEGRRPAGIAGACLLLAARMNNFRRTHAEIVAVARVGGETLQKRLNEFKGTSSASLSIDEFRDSSHTNDSAPPSWKKNRQNEEKIERLRRKQQKTLEKYQELARDKRLFNHLRLGLSANGRSLESTPVPNDEAEKSEKSGTEELEEEVEEKENEAEEPEAAEAEEAENEAAVEAETENSAQSEAEAENEAESEAGNQGNGAEVEDAEAEGENGDENDGSESEPEYAPIFVESDDDFGYEDLPEAGDSADEDYEEHHRNLVLDRSQRTLRPRESGRLGSSSRLGSITDSPRLRKLAPTPKRRGVNSRASRAGEESSAREDELLKAVLNGGDIKEEDLVVALDKVLRGQQQMLDNSLYKTPAELENEKDISRQIELDRPRNLVKHNPTTQEVLAKVRDDEEVNTDDEDDEVLSIRLTDAEKSQKERIWIALNHDFLIAQEKKRLKREADELTGNTSGQPRKRRRVREQENVLNDSNVVQAIGNIGESSSITPAESTRNMLSSKPFSKKINYTSLDVLFNEDQ